MRENTEHIELSFDDALTNFVHELPADCMQSIRQNVQRIMPSLIADFRLTLVLDTNILFKAVRSRVIDKAETFLEKIAATPCLRICAPRELEMEIMEKIEKKFPRDKKVKHVEVEYAQNEAREILRHIEIIDDIEVESIAKAKEELGGRDPKDVPFLALLFSTDAKAIITDDKDYENTTAESWKAGQAGRVATVVNKGTVCFAATAVSFKALEILYKNILIVIWDKLISIAKKSGGAIMKGYEYVSQLNGWLKLAIIAFVGIVEYKTKFIRNSVGPVCEFLKKAGNVFMVILEFIANVAGHTVMAYGVLFDYQQQAFDEIANLGQGVEVK